MVWNWQGRFMVGGFDGLLHDNSHPSYRTPIPIACSRQSSDAKQALELLH